MRRLATLLLTGFALSLAATAVSAAGGVRVGPEPFADRRFPYVEEGTAFAGTPLAQEGVRLPAPVLVHTGDAAVAARLGEVAFMLGQFSEAAPVGAAEMRSRQFRPLVSGVESLGGERPAIVAGRRETLPEALRAQLPPEAGKTGPAVWTAALAGQPVLVLTGPGEAEVLQAVDYLAYDRLFFKDGAYDGFFAFVRLRGHLEAGELAAALQLLDQPGGVAGCAKPVTQMAPRMAEMPPAAAALAKKRNGLVFGELRRALEARDQGRATAAWKEAMATCYACHQGRGGPEVRKFKPLEYPHREHQTIARQGGLSCAACHQGVTAIAGY